MKAASVLRRNPFRLSLMVCLVLGAAAPLCAAADEKSVYVGGTPTDFPGGGSRTRITAIANGDMRRIEGTLRVDSPAALTFEAGRDGQLTIAYDSITAMSLGLEPRGLPSGGVYVISWDPLDQYSDKAHYLLSVAYRDETGTGQGVVFELGKKSLRPTLERLEAVTHLPLQFDWYSSCEIYKSAERCGRGTPAELRGLTRVFVDAGDNAEYRTLIAAELEKAHLGVELVPLADAQIVLRFRGQEFYRPNYIQALHGGRGEVHTRRNDEARLILAFTGTRLRAFGNKPATKFAAAFVAAYRAANR